jgi:hypothetical protein
LIQQTHSLMDHVSSINLYCSYRLALEETKLVRKNTVYVIKLILLVMGQASNRQECCYLAVDTQDMYSVHRYIHVGRIVLISFQSNVSHIQNLMLSIFFL